MAANKDFKKAETVGVFSPYVHLLSADAKFRHCDHCFVCSTHLKSCSKCKYMRYCCRNCQSEKGRSEMQEVLGIERNYSHLMSHVDEIKQSEKAMSTFMKRAVEIKHFISRNGDTNIGCSGDGCESDAVELKNPGMLLETFGKMVVNSYSILDEDLNNIGTGFYLGPSIIDHSCRPNCVITFNGINMVVKCLKDVSMGDRLYMSYVDLMNHREGRREHLLRTYFFHCECEACNDHEMERNMLTVRCLGTGQNDNSNDDACGLFKSFKDDLEAVKKSFDLLKGREVTEELGEHRRECFSKLLDTYSPINIHIFRSLDEAFEICIELELWSEACYYGEKLIPIYQFYLKDPNPNFGHFLVKLGKIYLYQMQRIEALKCLEKANDILSVTHSPENALYIRLQSLLMQCRQELSLM
ncbi:hypothetical protein HELRODRAFT_166414 [Helobdella robusta]|uniref:SET domain-containing protein n=1 Tax=Helobdella robusta TaxID=6412 RepID=T1EY40_HELRO|nr:hypothetical protein HELRODRAFT_166414 [Helobdella robusta]ESN90710.1 hypothetical protein HELRODRAFT_166414 [Helobdella robusta]